MAESVYDFEVKKANGGVIRLDCYRGQVLLIVNVASQCALTPQYAGLEALYRRHHERGFEILGFPCNQFGHQEPGDDAEIQKFCSLRYDVTFPIFSKIDVNGSAAHPLYRFLKAQKRGFLGTRAIKWNFTKFLVNQAGKVVKRFGPATRPQNVEQRITRLLNESPVP